MKDLWLFFCILLLSTSCNKGPKKIAYGEQSCEFCQMTIVDTQHAAQLITDKGKVHNFDAAECLIHYMADLEPKAIGLLLVSDYNSPESLIDAETATYVISKEIPSPMGANLSAVAKYDEAIALLRSKKGEIYSWEALLQHFNEQ